MERQNNDTHVQAHAPMPTQLKLAAAWTSFMFLAVYVDILGFYKPGVVEDILAGRVWEFQITQTFLVIALALMAVQIAMITLSAVLPDRANRIANLVAASLFVPVVIFNAIGESWTYYYWGAVVLELVVLALILRLAWAFPRVANSSPAWSRNAAAVTR
jgi:hypothetical protein